MTRAVLCLLLSVALWAQGLESRGTGEVTGQVRDPMGAAVPFAGVELHLRGSGERIVGRADQRGRFVFRGVRPGLYGIGVHAPSFTQTNATEVLVVEGGWQSQDVRLQQAPRDEVYVLRIKARSSR